MNEWKLGDKHPDAPWTKDGVPFTCPVCGALSKQGLGVGAIAVSFTGPQLDATLHAYCEQHLEHADD